MIHPSLAQTSTNQIFLPVTETLWKKLQNAWYENGFVEALRVVASSQRDSDGFSITGFSAQQLLSLINISSNICSWIPFLISKDTDNEAYPTSSVDCIRCIDWHPHCTKLAIAAKDDSVRIYSSHTKLIPLLKCKTQRNVSSLAWRPLSSSDIAVGCEAGVYIWIVDPNSVVMRPSASSAVLLKKPHHTNVSSISWSPQGDLLVSVSKWDRKMYVWEVSTEKAVALKCVGGGGISLVTWSPDNTKVFAAMNRIVFRVWETSYWNPELWSLRNGRVVAACWSACSSALLFATSTESVIYALTFGPMAAVFNSENTRSAASIIDVAAITLSNGERVGGEVNKMVWDGKSRYLAVTFHHSDLIAVFMTNISSTSVHVSPCCFIRGLSGEMPIVISFQKNFSEGANLTIAWSSQRVQYFPFVYTDLKSPGSTTSPPKIYRQDTSTVLSSIRDASQFLSFASP
ncbi:aladin-like isoform X2 [Lycorma delicatula]